MHALWYKFFYFLFDDCFAHFPKVLSQERLSIHSSLLVQYWVMGQERLRGQKYLCYSSLNWVLSVIDSNIFHKLTLETISALDLVVRLYCLVFAIETHLEWCFGSACMFLKHSPTYLTSAVASESLLVDVVLFRMKKTAKDTTETKRKLPAIGHGSFKHCSVLERFRFVCHYPAILLGCSG